MRIIQISDIHIDLPEVNPYEIDVRNNFIRVLEETVRLSPDYIVVTGDLCNRGGDIEIYAWIKLQLESTSIPYEVIPGNHDDRQLLDDAFKGVGAISLAGKFAHYVIDEFPVRTAPAS